MSRMVKEQSFAIRTKAVGMVEGGMTQNEVAVTLGVNIRTVRRWLAKDKAGDSLENKPGRGPKPKLHRVAKIVIGKSLGKKGQSTRKLAKRLTRHGYSTSHMTVQRHLRKNLHVVPYKLTKQPKLTPEQKKKRPKFALERKNWTVEDWQRVLWTDESPFEILYTISSK